MKQVITRSSIAAPFRFNGTVIPYGPRALQKHTEDRTRQLSQVAAAAPAQASEMASYLNKRAKVSSEALTGDGDLVSDVLPGAPASPPSGMTICRRICAR